MRKNLSMLLVLAMLVSIVPIFAASAFAAAPATLFSDDFTEGTGKWSPYTGNGSWSVIQDSGRSWYRQSATGASMAYTTAGNPAWTDYSVEAVVKVAQFSPDNYSGVGIITRFVNNDNYFRFWCVVNSSGVGDLLISYRKNASSFDLVDMPFVMELNREYLFKAVVDGVHLQFYVDGVLMLECDASDPLTGMGPIGLQANRADARFTDVVVTDLAPATDPAADIEAAKTALTWDVIKGGNLSQDNVISDLNLPITGANGTDIAWSASPVGNINLTGVNRGAVTRPIGADQAVELTATISKGGMSDTLTFYLTLPQQTIVDIAYSRVVYDKNPAAREHAAIDVKYSGDLLGIRNGSYNLIPGADYTVDSGVVTIPVAYLDSFNAGAKETLTFDFGGDSKTMNIWIQESIDSVVPYAHALLDPQSIRFSVKVDGTPVYVGNFLGQNYTHFAFEDAAEIEVTCMGSGLGSGVRPEDTGISPDRLGIPLDISGNTITFTIDEARQYALRVNVPLNQANGGQTDYYLFIYADAMETDAPNLNAPNIINILDFGADPTGKIECSAAVDAATAACPAGGIVYFPAGKYWVDGARADKSEVTYYLDPYAIVIAYEYYDGYDYDDNRPSSAFTVFGWDWDNKSSRNLHSVNFKGRGIIQAAGWVIWAEYTPNMVVKDLMMRCHGVQGDLGVSYVYDGHTIPALGGGAVPGVAKAQAGRAFQPYSCAGIYVYNIKGMVLLGMNVGPNIDYGMYVDGDWGKPGAKWVYGKDSLNLDSCDGGVMELCSGVSNDDKFCSKLDDDNWGYRTGGVDMGGNRNAVITYDMKFIDCIGFGGASSGKVGSSNRISGDGMLYEDMTLMCPITIDTNVDWNSGSAANRGLTYKDILFRNCYVDLVRANNNAFLAVVGANTSGIAATLKNLVFENLTVAYALPNLSTKNTGININFNTAYAGDITFKNLKVAGQYITCFQDLADLGFAPSVKVSNADLLKTADDWNASVIDDGSHRIEFIVEMAVTFDLGYDNLISQTAVLYNSVVEEPADPVRDGYIFTGWFAGADLAIPFDFDAAIVADTVIYAGWTPALVSVDPSATVIKQNGNTNVLVITVIETYSDGTVVELTETLEIESNSAGIYQVGVYKVYVDTKGNTQVRDCRIVG